MKNTLGLTLLAFTVLMLNACGNTAAAPLKEIESHKAGSMVVSLLSETGELTQGKNKFEIAFHPQGSKESVDVGTVTMGASMTMPGMAPMPGPMASQVSSPSQVNFP
jgi:hypothetical protein